MHIEYRPGNYASVVCELLAFPVFEDEGTESKPLKALDESVGGAVSLVLESGEFKPELHRICMIHHPSGLKSQRLLLVGAGEAAQFSPARLREVTGCVVRAARAAFCKSVAYCMRGNDSASLKASAAAEGAIYANYEADVYKTRDKEKEGRDIEKLLLIAEARMQLKDAANDIRRGVIIAEATNVARTLANEPSNILTPSQLAERAMLLGADAGLDVQVLEREEMQQMGMNALLAVSRGSDEPPKLLILRIKGQEKKAGKPGPFYAFVGKGVTFDSGGISIKPAEKMEDMKADMAGGAAVLGAMIALARLKPRHQVIGLIPAVENLPSGRATKPGDVVKSYLGKSIEIINTDAEGRLILADALAYARSLGANHLIDVATLTGACVVALGAVNAGMMGTDQKTMDRLRENCRVTGEKLWQLPLDDEYKKALRSEIADMKNIGSRYGGAITAGKFLQEFVEDTPWVHLDIAAMELDHDGRPYACKGATGFGVRTLVQLLL